MKSMPLLSALTRLEVATSDVDFSGLVAIGQLTALCRLSLADCQVRRRQGSSVECQLYTVPSMVAQGAN